MGNATPPPSDRHDIPIHQIFPDRFWGGNLLVADMSGLLRITDGGAVSQIAAGTSSTHTGALYCAGAGLFLGFPYLGSNSSNRVERYEAGVGNVPFASPVNGFEDVVLGTALFGGV